MPIVLTRSSRDDESAFSEPAVPFNPCTSHILSSIEGEHGDRFGYALDLSASGHIAIVGAYKASLVGVIEDSGKAFTYVKNQDGEWNQEAELHPDDSQRGDHFGVKLALDASGTMAVISADAANESAGAAYIFVRTPNAAGNFSKWTQHAKLELEDATPGAQFGDSVAIKGDTIAVGVSFADALVKGVESVYIFAMNKTIGRWERQARLIPDDASEYSSGRFGRSVALSETADTLVVGADTDEINGPFSGAAYIFRRQRGADGVYIWTQEAKIAPNDGGMSQYFGFDLDIDSSGNIVVVSSWKDGKVVVPPTETTNAKTEQIGSVYVFTRSFEGSKWHQTAKLVASDGEEKDRFGCSVAVSDDASRILIGAYHDDDRRGSAYLFDRTPGTTSWVQKMKLRADNVEVAELYGYQVALDSTGRSALISEYGDANKNGRYEVGSAHVVELDDSCMS